MAIDVEGVQRYCSLQRSLKLCHVFGVIRIRAADKQSKLTEFRIQTAFQLKSELEKRFESSALLKLPFDKSVVGIINEFNSLVPEGKVHLEGPARELSKNDEVRRTYLGI